MSTTIDTDERHPLPSYTHNIHSSHAQHEEDISTEHPPAATYLIPIDLSPSSLQALQYAVASHSPISTDQHTKFVLLHVLAESSVADLFYADEVSGTNLLSSKLREDSKKVADFCAPVLKPTASLAVVVDVRIGSPGEVICQAAKEFKARRVIMGSRGLGFVKRMLLGSVSTFTIEHSRVPVSIVKLEDDGSVEIEEYPGHRHH
ncbi:hypothetical protein BC832DRAFT_348517 [Gaertneriomyces semiglobifer]|nr:hypothetical protein BC832DRAFT_348517 [Gaertneriomyces semiglobifer]